MESRRVFFIAQMEDPPYFSPPFMGGNPQPISLHPKNPSKPTAREIPTKRPRATPGTPDTSAGRARGFGATTWTQNRQNPGKIRLELLRDNGG